MPSAPGPRGARMEHRCLPARQAAQAGFCRRPLAAAGLGFWRSSAAGRPGRRSCPHASCAAHRAADCRAAAGGGGRPEPSEAAARSGGEASSSGSVDEEELARILREAEGKSPEELLAAIYDFLPLEQLRRPGDAGWGGDLAGPLGPEKFDNEHQKEQMQLNSTAIEVIGMGTWRLQTVVSPPVQALVANIEGAWRHLIEGLGLYSFPKEWQYTDSLDPDNEYGSWSYQDLEPPARGEPGWPRLQIENRCYRSRVFRKLHLELAHRQDGLEVFHCVMYPWVTYDLPILSMDVVAVNGRFTLGIVDPCPVALDRSLPPVYAQMCRELQAQLGVGSNRSAPEWGREIFSEFCVMMRPESDGELLTFLKYAISLARVHLRFAHQLDPVQQNKQSRMRAISAAQRRYSEQQLRNSKTRRVLEAAFSPEFAERYMTGMMFDTAPAEAGAEPAAASPTADSNGADGAQQQQQQAAPVWPASQGVQ